MKAVLSNVGVVGVSSNTMDRLLASGVNPRGQKERRPEDWGQGQRLGED